MSSPTPPRNPDGAPLLQPPKESFARRYKFMWPLLLAVNFTAGGIFPSFFFCPLSILYFTWDLRCVFFNLYNCVYVLSMPQCRFQSYFWNLFFFFCWWYGVFLRVILNFIHLMESLSFIYNLVQAWVDNNPGIFESIIERPQFQILCQIAFLFF